VTDVEIDVALVEAEIAVAPVSVTIDVTRAQPEIEITPPNLVEIDLTTPPAVELTTVVSPIDITITSPPVVVFDVGGSGPNEPGQPGPPGPQGPPGVSNATYSGVWRWITNTLDASIPGQVGTDVPGWDGAFLHINERRDDNTDVGPRLLLVKVGDSIRVQHRVDSTRFADYTVNAAPTDEGTWLSFPVTMDASGGVVPNNNTEVLVILRVQGSTGGSGNRTYLTPPVENLPPESELVEGDLWIQGENNNATWRWSGTEWVDVHNLNIDMANSGIEGNSDQINLLNQQLSELQLHVDDVEKTSNSIDGRVTFSDYIPQPEDAYFPVITVDPVTLENVVTYVPRVEGSVWFQRTRPRRNLVTNPSFEKNDLTWQPTNCTFVRVDPPDDVPDVAGGHCLQVTSTAAGNAILQPTYTFTAAESKWYAGSMHMMLVSGSGVGCFATLAFYDAGNVLLASVTGEVEDLVQLPPDAEHWNRLNVVAQAPAGTTYFRFALHNPNPSDVWYAGAAIVENLDELGKYFDGDSFDGFWEGGLGNPLQDPNDNPVQGEQGWQESTSRLYGDKIIGVWELHSQTWVRKFFTEDTLDQIDSSKITNLDHLAQSLPPNMITTDKISVGIVLASEKMWKGDLVNLYNYLGTFRVRHASAALGREATGFILEDVELNMPVNVYSSGTNNFQAGLVPGPQWLSEAAGLVSNTPPSTIGYLVQQIGYAADTFILNFHPLIHIKLV
jgi:hypothetical protein